MADENTNNIRDRLRTTFMGLAGLLSKMNVMQGDNPNASNTAILDVVENIDSSTSGFAKQGTNTAVTLTSVDDKIDNFYDTFDSDIALQLSEIIGDGSSTGDTSQTAQQLSVLRTLQESYNELVSNMNKGIPSCTITNDVTGITLSPNTLYTFNNRTADIVIDLEEGLSGYTNEYHFIVHVGNTVPTITLPIAVSFGFDINTGIMEPNKTYEFSILDNIGIMCGW